MGWTKFALLFGWAPFTWAAAEPTMLSYVNMAHLKSMPEFVWGRDPFLKSPGYDFGDSSGDPRYHLEAVIYSAENPRALINGQIVTPGASLKDGTVIKEIGANFVVIRQGSALRELTIKTSAMKPNTTGEK